MARSPGSPAALGVGVCFEFLRVVPDRARSCKGKRAFNRAAGIARRPSAWAKHLARPGSGLGKRLGQAQVQTRPKFKSGPSLGQAYVSGPTGVKRRPQPLSWALVLGPCP